MSNVRPRPYEIFWAYCLKLDSLELGKEMRNLSGLSVICLVLLSSVGAACGAESPTVLAAQLRSAIEAKDVAAAGKLVEWGQAPVAAYRLFKMSVADCFAPAVCKVEVAEISDEEKKAPQDYYFPIVPEGRLKIVPPEGGEGFSMPFAKVGDKYRIVIGQQTKKAYDEAKSATEARKAAEELDADLLASGQALPADGGAPAKTYREYLAAISRGDTAYLAQGGTSGDRYLFGTAYIGNPIKADITLDLMRMESISEPAIKGGFVKDNRAILLVSGTSGVGWTTEGAVTLVLEGGKWSIDEKRYRNYPPSQESK